MSQTRIRVPVTYVDIPVLALDRAGSPIGGLSRDIFRVQDDGRPQRIAAFDGEPRPIALAIVVDTFQPEAVAQAQRAAEVIANMVVGDSGVAALFIGGPEPREILPFTGDRNRLVDALKHLELNAHGPDITAPLQLAISRVRQQPREDTRAVLVISRQSSRGGHFAGAIVEMSMNDAIPVFRISPNRPKQPLPQNPVSTDNNGPGPGSSRQQPHVPTGAEQPIPPPQGGTAANIDPGVILSKIGGALARGIDYVHATGGLTLKPSNDGDFDRELSKVGDALRYVYHVFYRPDDLTPDPQLHSVTVQVNRAGIKQLAYRHTYVAVLVQ
jgi:VWFA-related protein